MADRLHIRLLGEFWVEAGGCPPISLASPRLQSLLAYLLLHRDTPTPRRQLAFLFWPDSSEAQALTNLRKLLHLLHQTLPTLRHFLHEERHGLTWRLDGSAHLDVEAFERAMCQAQHASERGDETTLREALEQAAALYKGDLIPTCYDDWILPIRERLHHSFFVGLDRLIDLLESTHEFPVAIAYSQRLLRHDPLQEATYRRLMKLHALSGDRNAVRRVYQACVTNVKREFEAAPAPATQLLYQQLTATPELTQPRRVSAPSSRPSTNLGLPPTSFVGREQEQAAVLRLLRRSSVRLLTITGPPGVGKTRLAAEAALRLLDDFPFGVFNVDLALVADPDCVPAAIARAVELAENGGRPLLDRLKSFLRDKPILLLLDNFEHLLPAAPPLAEVLGTCPGLKMLITSRTPLRLRGEHVLRLPPLGLPPCGQPLPVAQVGQYAAVQLFIERAQVAQPDFLPTERNVSAIAEIVHRLDGLPLTIEWAAARLRYLPPEVMLPRLENRLKLLVQGARDLPERQQSLRDAIAWSYDLLTDSEQKLFRRLAVFVGGCDVEAAALCDLGDASGDDPHEGLMALTDKSLLLQEDRLVHDHVAPRFTMLETIREYALARLHESGEADLLRARHAAYYLRLRAVSGTACRAAERANLQAAQAWAAQQVPGGVA